MSAWDIGETVNQVLDTRSSTGNKYIGGDVSNAALRGNPNSASNVNNYTMPLLILGATVVIGLLIWGRK